MKKNKIIVASQICLLLITGLFYTGLHASKPRIRSMSSFSEFRRATLRNMSVLAGGKLTLAPQKTLLIDSDDPFIWAIALDRKGNIYLGTGNDGRVYRVNANGDSTLFFDSKELEIYALAIDGDDNLYAGSSPDGRVYKIRPDGKSFVFYEPKSTYIWDLLFDHQGNLLIATGEEGRILCVKPDGTGQVLFNSEQTHVRTLALASDGTLFAGTSGHGVVYKIDHSSGAYALFDTGMEEVQSLAVSSGGCVYAAAFRDVGLRPGPRTARVSTATTAQVQTEFPADGEPGSEIALAQMSITPESAIPPSAHTMLFRIDTNGYAKDIWNISDAQIQTILLDEQDRLWIGTGDKGKLYRLEEDGEYSLVLSGEDSQISDLCMAEDRQLILATSNIGRCFIVDSGVNTQGKVESEVIDANNISSWGILSWKGEMNGGGAEFYTRSGNTEKPESSWSDWERVENGRITSPAARFIQWKCEMFNQGEKRPVIDKVSVSYLEKNHPPEILSMIVFPPNDYYIGSETGQGNASNKSEKKGIIFPQPMSKQDTRRGFRSVGWLFADPNQDALLFDVYFRKVDEKTWRKLVEELDGNVYAWDTLQMQDGDYLIKVVASDAPNQPQEMALAFEKLSDIFTVDNRGPVISDIKTKRTGSKTEIIFSVEDAVNVISEVEYAVDVGGWRVVYPTDGICDSKKELFKITIEINNDAPYEVSIKARDAFGNFGTAHTMVRGDE